MAFRMDIIVFFLCFIYVSNNLTKADWGLSTKEELEFKKQFLNLEKFAIKSIQIGDGDIYDCIDFYKQPGFNHPFWKNTTFEMKRKLFVEGRGTNANSPLNTRFKGVGCPYGTVPIRRVNKDDLGRAKMHPTNIDEEPGHHYAILRTKADPNRKLVGIESYFRLFNPRGIIGSQYSAFRMTLSNGLDSIKTGFTVNPLLFKDNKTRLFTHVTIDGRIQCYNQDCPGYVQINSDIPLGWTSPEANPEIYAIKLRINKGICDGPNSTKCLWTLYFDDENSVVGFWPPTLFGQLSEFANQADWGGEVYSPLDQPSPPMGTGKLPHQRGWHTIDLAHSRRIACTYENAKFLFLNPIDTELYKSDEDAYNIIDAGYRGEYWGREILYDGPGGIKGA
ncbi:protein neprosin-like [Corylus avellana]|uniref:protein neprosin-like n=1 Tax=Corylus avellana TaxID=13451 RepID=UPI00286D3269|nr:protein neprosin-like [Corylus avellana]